MHLCFDFDERFVVFGDSLELGVLFLLLLVFFPLFPHEPHKLLEIAQFGVFLYRLQHLLNPAFDEQLLNLFRSLGLVVIDNLVERIVRDPVPLLLH